MPYELNVKINLGNDAFMLDAEGEIRRIMNWITEQVPGNIPSSERDKSFAYSYRSIRDSNGNKCGGVSIVNPDLSLSDTAIERERCAKLAQNPSQFMKFVMPEAVDIGNQIAIAIRDLKDTAT